MESMKLFVVEKFGLLGTDFPLLFQVEPFEQKKGRLSSRFCSAKHFLGKVCNLNSSLLLGI